MMSWFSTTGVKIGRQLPSVRREDGIITIITVSGAVRLNVWCARNMLIILKSLPNASDTEELQSAVDHSDIGYRCERRMSADRCDFDLCSECAMKNIKMGRKTECSKGHQLSAFEVGDF